ncbi:hypothetical protein [Actinoplanes utahensis]|uniref:Uncharacterized protein n=1 Tax=Actinoplanes utahensis TaxID=1869 RepID=A0A0A6UEH5_ACTUT|nr:hypothetical protein [Actinoplanes utahensis]KHD73478.1 hypothetical protein MB27_34765 [Actinoplanes utahensis]
MPEDLGESQSGPWPQFLAAPVVAPPEPWRRAGRPIAVGGLIGAGFGVHPGTGRDLLLAASHSGLGLFDTVTGERLARDYDNELAWPADDDLTCAGIGALAGTRVRMAGLLGGGLHRVAPGGWVVDVVTPDWPKSRVLLATGFGPWRGDHGETWWHVFHAGVTELRAAGFSPSGDTLIAATSSDVSMWTRAPATPR